MQSIARIRRFAWVAISPSKRIGLRPFHHPFCSLLVGRIPF